jgi:hypothetical protein
MMRQTITIIAGLLAACAAVQGEEAPSAAGATDASNIILAPKPAETVTAAATDPAARPPSPGIEADLHSQMPAYSPPQAQAAAAADPRAADKPLNQIPRIPAEVMARYVVHERRVPVFRERDLYTKAGLVEISLKEHPGLRVGNIFNLNAPAAYSMYLDEQERSEKAEMEDTAYAMAVGGDVAEAKDILDMVGGTLNMNEDLSGPVGIKRDQ